MLTKKSRFLKIREVFFLSFSKGLGRESSFVSMLSKCSTTELHPPPQV